jgi:outer membrane protein TolC
MLMLGAARGHDALAQEPAPKTQEPGATQAGDQPLSLPLSPIELAQKNGMAVSFSLKDLTKLALQNNLDIAISDTNEELYNQRVRQVYGAYDPTLTFTPGVQRSKRANTRLDTASTAGAGYNQTDYLAWDARFDQALPTGGTVRATMNSNRSDTNQAFALFTPQYSTQWQFQFTQPVWRNFRIDQTRGNIKLANLDMKLNDSQFKQKVMDTIARIQALYWDLVGTIRDYEINRESVKLAQISLQNNQKKVEIGTLAPIAITEAQAELANREVNMIVAAQRINTVQNNLRNLVSNDRHAEIWRQTIVPTEAPDFKEYKVDLDHAIDTALANRPELEQLAIRTEQNDISYSMYKDRTKWQVDLVAQFGTSGVAGPQTLSPEGIPLIRPELVGGPGHAYGVMFTEGFTNWFVGAQIQIPLKNRSLESQMAQVKIQNRQNLMNRRVVEQLIQTEIRNAFQTIETNRQQVETAKVARQLAEEQLVGEEKRFQAGLSENFRVLDRQRSLSQAQGVELQALIAYKRSIIDLEKAMYTLLESNDFEIAKTSSDAVPQLK